MEVDRLFSEQQSHKDLITDHSSPQTHQIDLQQIVELIDCIFNIALATKEDDVESEKLKAMMSSLENIDGMREALTDIRHISCEMSCNLVEGTGNLSKTKSTMEQRLRKYSGNGRAVLAIAAFASSIGELSMLGKHCNHSISKFMNAVKGHSLKLDFKALQSSGLIDAMKKVSRTSLDFSNIRRDEFSENIIDNVLQISTTLSKREDIGDDELTTLTRRLIELNDDLREKLVAARKVAPYDYEDERKPILNIRTSELIENIKKYTEDPEKLRNKHVLFLISDLDISIEEIKVLNGLYQKNDNKYEILWVPIVELSVNDKRAEAKFGELKQMMKWIAVKHSKIEAQVIECIKKDWQFIKQAIAVSVKPSGAITSLNALPMLWTWGNSAFPFIATREQALWKERVEQNGWRLHLLFDELDLPNDIDMQSWTKSEGTFVCLFGGGDMSWIQAFTEKVKIAAHAAGVSLKLVYLGVGKSKGKGLTRNEFGRGIHVIESESQWHFWTRLESILYYKIKLGKTVNISRKDPVMQEALKVVGYGGNGKAWAMFSMGTSAMVTTSGKTALSIMENYKKWIKENVGNRFFNGIEEYNELIMRDVHSCINVNLPVMGEIPGIMMCPECSKVMDMFYTYRCCPESLLC
ncbi:hypothetical protein F3Y22_tig00110307pilonHSYRG00172 [Hibiscus syriacus]|uniref:Protein SIEVE ELEMENT OCCLUSION B-like n=1 Tax=Hibiscus syriacus TaxID=106335 RepID=A0A6A3B2Y9_HIBSY|nr:protein SIEVE ELEMENT OCCLUSION B-like [Hibiscus syriacus]KAE8711021.1 hypothetical protein F3Y22_tig00110307pilonHSYRG00172 [Hibiscus syriacus]